MAFLATGSLYAFNTNVDSEVYTSTYRVENTVKCKYDQCHATAKSTGERCKHCVSNDGDTYCWQHKD